MMTLDAVATEARACTICAASLPLGPRPVLRVSATARLLIIGQAPGTNVHATGIPWNDQSGDRLRLWLNMDQETFYDAARIAILPMGLCYPGRLANGGDAPPRPECAPHWHPRLLPLMPDIRLTLLVGGYAQAGALGKGTMTERVRNFTTCLPKQFPCRTPPGAPPRGNARTPGSPCRSCRRCAKRWPPYSVPPDISDTKI